MEHSNPGADDLNKLTKNDETVAFDVAHAGKTDRVFAAGERKAAADYKEAADRIDELSEQAATSTVADSLERASTNYRDEVENSERRSATLDLTADEKEQSVAGLHHKLKELEIQGDTAAHAELKADLDAYSYFSSVSSSKTFGDWDEKDKAAARRLQREGSPLDPRLIPPWKI